MAGELRATLLTTVKGDAVKKLQKDLGGLSDSLKGIGGTVSKVAKGFAGFATAIGATKFISGSIDQAKLLEQSYRSLETVFGPLTGEMQRFAEGAAKIGLSQTEAAKASIFIGGVLQQYGVSTDKAAESTQKLVSLAADLAFVYGYDVQEALLGMTALFRGEYDPIEKFGVAMKQNEIESIKAARGLAHLTGAAEMNADVLIRQELLFQRTGKSLGAFTDNTDTLAVQSEIMRATFENLQATLGQQLTPVITEFFSQLIPIIEEAGPGLVDVFKAVAQVIKELGEIFVDLFDPTTNLGNSASELAFQFNSLWETIFGRDFDIAQVFDGVGDILSFIIDSVKNLIKFIETIIIYTQAWGQYLDAIFKGDWDTVAKGVDVIANKMLAARDAAIQLALANQLVIDSAASSIKAENLRFENLRPDVQVGPINLKPSSLEIDKGGQKKTDAVKDFFAGLKDEIAKEGARLKLEAAGASEGLIDAILGAGKDWKKVFDAVLKNGVKSVKAAQDLFNKTADGIKEIEEQANKLLEAEIQRAKQMMGAQPHMKAYWEAYITYLEQGIDKQQALTMAQADFDAQMAEQAAKLAAENAKLRKEFNKSVREALSAFEMTGVVQDIGEFESAARGLKEELIGLVKENLRVDGVGLFSEEQQENLIKLLRKAGSRLEAISRERDKIQKQVEDTRSLLEEQQANKKSLMESLADSILGNVNITQIGGKAANIVKSLQNTLKQTQNFSAQLLQLRQMGLSEGLIQQIIGSGAQIGGATAKALIEGGPDAIGEVNNLYKSIGDVASQIGSESANAMFDAGIQTTQALLDGLLSQESQLKQVAELLADSFRNAFKMRLTDANISQFLANLPNIPRGTSAVTSASMTASSLASAASVSKSGAVYNITINPGLITDPVGLGREIVNSIQRYESTNGRVWARA